MGYYDYQEDVEMSKFDASLNRMFPDGKFKKHKRAKHFELSNGDIACGATSTIGRRLNRTVVVKNVTCAICKHLIKKETEASNG